MARRYGAAFRSAIRSKRQNVWIGLQTVEQAIAANSVVLVGTLNAAALALRPFTIVRSRILMWWSSDQTAANEFPLGAYGHIIVSDQATAAGVASIPDPTNNADAPFHVWEPLIASIKVITQAGTQDPQGRQFVVDSKAMRKVGNNEDLATVLSNAHATDGATFSEIGRILVKLH